MSFGCAFRSKCTDMIRYLMVAGFSLLTFRSGVFFPSGAFFSKQPTSKAWLAGRWRGYNTRTDSSYLITGVILLVDIAWEFQLRALDCLSLMVLCCVILSVR